jgi:integrase
MGEAFDCPLSGPAVALLEALKGDETPDPKAYIFKGRFGGHLGESTLRRVLERVCGNLGVEAPTPHGYRSALRDFAGDRTNHQRETAEAALAHQVSTAVERAY